MSRRNPNKHTITAGAFKLHGMKQHSHTASGLARTYFAHPPEGGWPGGLPESNGWRPGKGK